MKKLIETGFFAMLAENSKENFSQEEFRNAVCEFVDELLMLCRMETDLPGSEMVQLPTCSWVRTRVR